MGDLTSQEFIKFLITADKLVNEWFWKLCRKKKRKMIIDSMQTGKNLV